MRFVRMDYPFSSVLQESGNIAAVRLYFEQGKAKRSLIASGIEKRSEKRTPKRAVGKKI